jgi:Dihydrodipicolinate synthase/N-acetylneuraminate lyase
MNPKKYSGIFPALLTPFRADGTIDEKATEALIEMTLRRGVTGFYVGGSSAEAFLMSAEERMLALRLYADIVGGRATMIAQVGDASEDKALRLATYARRCGYDAVSAVTPFYYKFSYENIINYYRDIAAVAELPLFVYYIPALSGVNLTLGQVLDLISPDYVAGIKYTCQDLYMFERIKSTFPAKTTLFGVDEMLLPALTLGADGAIGTTYNFMPEKAAGIVAALAAGNLTEARLLQNELNTVISCLLEVGVFEGSKALLNLMGLDIGQCRRPFGVLSQEKLRLLRDKALPLMQTLN